MQNRRAIYFTSLKLWLKLSKRWCVICLIRHKQVLEFSGITAHPVVSLLRNFSAPVNLEFNYSNDELAFLMQHETNGFNQWQATQTLLNVFYWRTCSRYLFAAMKNTVPALIEKILCWHHVFLMYLLKAIWAAVLIKIINLKNSATTAMRC